MFYRQEKNCKEKLEKKSRESKDTTTPTCRSSCIYYSTNVVDHEKNSCDDVHLDIEHGDVCM